MTKNFNFKSQVNKSTLIINIKASLTVVFIIFYIIILISVFSYADLDIAADNIANSSYVATGKAVAYMLFPPIIGLAYIFKLFYKHDLALNKSLLVSYISYIAKEINEPEIVNKHDGYKKIYDLNGECFGDLSAEDKYIVILMIHKDYIDINDVFDLNNLNNLEINNDYELTKVLSELQIKMKYVPIPKRVIIK